MGRLRRQEEAGRVMVPTGTTTGVGAPRQAAGGATGRGPDGLPADLVEGLGLGLGRDQGQGQVRGTGTGLVEPKVVAAAVATVEGTAAQVVAMAISIPLTQGTKTAKGNRITELTELIIYIFIVWWF